MKKQLLCLFLIAVAFSCDADTPSDNTDKPPSNLAIEENEESNRHSCD